MHANIKVILVLIGNLYHTRETLVVTPVDSCRSLDNTMQITECYQGDHHPIPIKLPVGLLFQIVHAMSICAIAPLQIQMHHFYRYHQAWLCHKYLT